METLRIKSAEDESFLEFYDRAPADRSLPILEFWVKIVDRNLTARGSVYAGYTCSHPAHLFADLARNWMGWKGELSWRSLEGEMGLCCAHDRLGHISIRVEMRSGSMNWDWSVRATIMAEAGQLDKIARQAIKFFGEPS